MEEKGKEFGVCCRKAWPLPNLCPDPNGRLWRSFFDQWGSEGMPSAQAVLTGGPVRLAPGKTGSLF